MKNSFFVFVLAALFFQSCGGAYRYAVPSTAGALAGASGSSRDEIYGPTSPIIESLFEEKDRTISEENIRKLLDGRLVLPDTLRVAVYKHGGSRWGSTKFGYYRSDEEFLKTQQVFIDTVVNVLVKNPRVQKVSLLPTMLIPANPTLTKLRESAVRLQADLLLVLAIQSDLYQKNKAFSKDYVKAYATTEALLLDVRTGLIPFSGIITDDFLSKETADDLNFAELRSRAERTAVLQTLGKLNLRLADFLKK